MREEAETLRLGLLAGLTQPEEVIAWADRVITELEVPPIELIDIALATGRPSHELLRMLRLLPGPADLALAAHHYLGLIHQRQLAGELTRDGLTECLQLYSHTAEIDEGERIEADNLSYSHRMLDHFGTLESWLEEVEDFFEANALGGRPAPSSETGIG
jgi:hypothetical protein